jgi:diketogulonate reductase-like aldo/keto reductase
MTHIDTAERYSAGRSEELVGAAIEPYPRENLFITTKVGQNHLRYDDVVASMKGSLDRLCLDYVDLYLIHWPNPTVPLEETMRAMEHCVDEGYTRFIGVSNFSWSLLAEARAHLGEHRLVADQVHYSLLSQEPARELLPHCSENDLILIAYSPLEKGRLTKLGYFVLDELAEKYGKTQAQISLNWLISQEGVVAIPKASRLEHVNDNAEAVGWKLSDEDVKRLAENIH